MKVAFIGVGNMGRPMAANIVKGGHEVATGQSFASSVVMKQFVLTEKYNTGFAVGLLAKDANIAAELSEQLGVDAPHIRLAGSRWAEARDELGAGEDNSKAILAWHNSGG